MMPDPWVIMVDDIQYKIYITYRQFDTLNTNDEQAKKRVFQEIYNRICEFRSKAKPPFVLPRQESMIMVQADDQGYQNTQMSQDSFAITQSNYGEEVEVVSQAFSQEKVKPGQSLLRSTVRKLQTNLFTPSATSTTTKKTPTSSLPSAKRSATSTASGPRKKLISTAVAAQSQSSSECSEDGYESSQSLYDESENVQLPNFESQDDDVSDSMSVQVDDDEDEDQLHVSEETDAEIYQRSQERRNFIQRKNAFYDNEINSRKAEQDRVNMPPPRFIPSISQSAWPVSKPMPDHQYSHANDTDTSAYSTSEDESQEDSTPSTNPRRTSSRVSKKKLPQQPMPGQRTMERYINQDNDRFSRVVNKGQ